MSFTTRLMALIFLSGLLANAHAASKPSQICHATIVAEVEIFCFRYGIGSFTAEHRALSIGERVEKLAADRTFDADRLQISDEEDSTDILARDQILISLRDKDLPPKVQRSRRDVAEEITGKLKLAIEKDRKDRSPREFSRGLLYTVAATAGLIIVLILVSLFYRIVYSTIRKGNGTYIPALRIKSYELLTSARLTETSIWIAQGTRVLLTIVLLYIYVPLVLSFFPATANLSPKIYGLIADPLQVFGATLLDHLPKLFFLIVLFL